MEVKDSEIFKTLVNYKTKEEFTSLLKKEAVNLREQMKVLSNTIAFELYEKTLELTHEERAKLRELECRLNGADTDIFMCILNLKNMLEELNKKDSSKDDILNP